MTEEDVLVVWSETGDLDDAIDFEDWGNGSPRLRRRDPSLPYADDALEAATFLMRNVRVELQLSRGAAKELMPQLPL